MLRSWFGLDGWGSEPKSVVELLRRTPPEQLEQRLSRLERRIPESELRTALVQLLGSAPVEHFGEIRAVYKKRFGGTF